MNERGTRVFLVAGEPSGDLLGGRLMAALKELTAGYVEFAGIGGEAMQAQGLESLFPMNELSVMGLLEVLPHISNLLRRARQTAEAIKLLEPDVVVTIDSPSFAYQVAKRIGNPAIPVVHYVAPTVWAWRPWRVRKIRHFFTHVLALLPFEPPFFEQAGVPCTFVGHPVVEYGADRGEGAAFRERYGIAETDPLICVLPGSRRSEVTRLAKDFGGALAILARTRPSLKAVVPTVPAVEDLVVRVTQSWPVPTLVLNEPDEKYAAMAASNAAIAASGTVVLELALASLPCVIAYRVSPLTAALFRPLMLVRHVSMINLILDRGVIPERLQHHCTPEILAEDIKRLLGPDGRLQVEQAQEALGMLGAEGEPPSRRAARAILDIIRERLTSQESLDTRERLETDHG